MPFVGGIGASALGTEPLGRIYFVEVQDTMTILQQILDDIMNLTTVVNNISGGGSNPYGFVR